MDIIKLLLTELEAEATTTRKFLPLVPTDKFGWAPHEKSMKMKSLASHIAELPTWITLVLTTDGLDFATAPYVEAQVLNNEDLIALFEKSYEDGKSHLEKASESNFNKSWILRHGEQVLADVTKYEMIRQVFSQITHHRAQLGVYLRLLNIPLPGSYGPSADNPSFD